MIRRGDIRWFRFVSPDKRRPVLVPVIPLSTHARGLSWEVRLSEEDGLPSECVLKPEWIRSVDRALLGALIASLPLNRWPEIRQAVLEALGLDHG